MISNNEMIALLTNKAEDFYSEVNNGARIVSKGEYKKYEYIIVSYGTHPCAYVKVPDTNKFYTECDEDEVGEYIDAHGGITFAGTLNKFDLTGFWIGWDYAHYGDYVGNNVHKSITKCMEGKKYSVENIQEECIDVIKQLMCYEETRGLEQNNVLEIEYKQ